MPQLQCHHVNMQYGNNLALQDISFQVQAGDYICIVGENGSGKSTLLKGILGLSPLKAGTITFGDGVGIREIGFLPQQTAVQQDFPASVYEVVLSGCLSKRGQRPFYSIREKQLALQNMRRLRIETMRRRSYRNLSGGQQQRVLLARALCATEKILFLDEPITGLDPGMTADFYGLLQELNQEGLTIVMTSHDIHSAIHHAGKILHLATSVLFFGKVEDYVKSEISKRFLGGDHSGCA